jgi:hypothetical protein
VLVGDAVLVRETEDGLGGRAASSFARGRANKLLRRDALLMTSDEVKRVLGCAAPLLEIGLGFSIPSRSIVDVMASLSR